MYSRIVGYFRPVQNWNIGKREEYKHRKMYSESKALAGTVSVEKAIA